MTVAGKVTAGYELSATASDRLVFLGQNVKNTMWFYFSGAGSGTWECKATGDSLYLTNNSQKQIWAANTAYVTFSFSVVLSQHSISPSIEIGDNINSATITGGTSTTGRLFAISATRSDGRKYNFMIDSYGYGVYDGIEGKTVWYKNIQHSISPAIIDKSSASGYYVCKIGRLAMLRVAISTSITDAWGSKVLGTLPAEYEPLGEVSVPVAIQSSNTGGVIMKLTHECNVIIEGKDTSWRSGWVFGVVTYVTV